MTTTRTLPLLSKREVTRMVLTGARELLSKPEDWTPFYSDYQTHCIVTAIRACQDHLIDYVGHRDALRVIAKVLGIRSRMVATWNDHSTHTKVLDVLDRAIARVSDNKETP